MEGLASLEVNFRDNGVGLMGYAIPTCLQKTLYCFVMLLSRSLTSGCY